MAMFGISSFVGGSPMLFNKETGSRTPKKAKKAKKAAKKAKKTKKAAKPKRKR